MLTAYGHPLLSFTSALEAKDPSYADSLFKERRAKIISSNGQHVVTLSSGVCDWNFTGYKASTSGLPINDMLDQMKLKSNANRVSVQTFNQQTIQLCTISGCPLKTVSLSSINR